MLSFQRNEVIEHNRRQAASYGMYTISDVHQDSISFTHRSLLPEMMSCCDS